MKTTKKETGHRGREIESQLQKWGAALDEEMAKVQALRERAEQVGAEAKVAMQESVAGIERKMDEMRAKLEAGREQYQKVKAEGEEALGDLRSGVGTAWENLKEGVESAWDELKSAVDHAAARFKSQDEPR